MSCNTTDSLHLLLTHADNRAPVLDHLDVAVDVDGTSMGTLASTCAPRMRKTLYDHGADPNDIAAQGWGVLVPEGNAEEILDALAPLIAFRERQLGAMCKIYRLPPSMDWSASLAWCAEVYHSTWMPEQIPRYLLLAGDLDSLSLELQQTLSYLACVGRIAFDAWTDYAAYAHKVVANETTQAAKVADLVFHTAADDSATTQLGRTKLIQPWWNMARIRHLARQLPVKGTPQLLKADRMEPSYLLQQSGQAERQVLVSLAHGLGAPASGWSTAAEQRTRQGELSLGNGETLTSSAVASRAFLPNGVWIHISCFGAGTPSNSPYLGWLQSMPNLTGDLAAAQLQQCLPMSGRPFVSGVAKAALANPCGPLAVFGYTDLAWLYGLVAASNTLKTRTDRFYRLTEQLLRGRRFGIALEDFHRDLRTIDSTTDTTVPSPHDDDRHRHLYTTLLRADLRSYVLIGDPAACI